MGYRMFVYVLIVVRLLVVVKGFSMHSEHVFNKHDNASHVSVRLTQEVRAASKLGCSKECTCRKCNGFFWYPSSKTCRLLVHDYIDSLQADSTSHTLYYKQGGTVQSRLPWLFCPTRRSGVTAALTKHREYRFFIHVHGVSHDDAIASCRRSGSNLMKISTKEKQKVVSTILSNCPDFAKHDFWIDGSKLEHMDWQYSDGTHIPGNRSHFWAPHNPTNHCKTCCVRLSSAHSHQWTGYACKNRVSGFICDLV